MYTCIHKSVQIVLERGSIDKPLTFNNGRLQLIFHLIRNMIIMHAKVFSIQIFNISAKFHRGFAFHYSSVDLAR